MKIQINENISSKSFFMIAMFSLFLFVVILGYTVGNLIKTRDYVKVKATIQDTITECSHSSSDDKQCTTFLKLEYQYDEISYYTEQRVIFGFSIFGSKINIYVNPENPEEVRDNYNTRLSIFLSLILLFSCYMTAKCYWIKKHQENGSSFDHKNDFGKKMLIRSPLK